MKAKHVLKKLLACNDAINWVGERTIEEAWAECERGDWMLWYYANVFPNNIRELTLAKAHCANTVRHLMKDERSLKAVDIAISFGEGNISKDDLQVSASAADAYASAADYASAYAATAATTSAYAATAAASAAAYSSVDAAAYVYAATENRKLTADICRKYLKLDGN